MNKKLRILGLIMVSTLVVSITGCKASDKSSDADKGALTFSITVSSNGVDNESSMIQKEWKKQMETKMGKKLNLKFNYIPSSEYDEKLKLMISSNDLTDFFTTPLFYDTTQMAQQGQILELMQYKKYMPNYMKYLKQVDNGISKATNTEGKMYSFKESSIPRFPADKGMLIQGVSSYRYDIFKKNNIKIPQTLDEVYDAAKKLKQLYPNKYPINARWNRLRSLFFANHIQDDIYWDGSKYVYGILEDGYKEALQYANKLYSEKLLDPEYTIDTDDTIKKKALNGDNFMWLCEWFTSPADYTRTANDGKIFAVSLYPDNPKYGKAWQNVINGNTPDLGWGTFCINAKTKNPKELVKFVDYQYSDDIIRLITWGIEGKTYKLGSDGIPKFTDEFKKAKDPWLVGDKYGIRASKHYSPGLQVSNDSRAFVDFAATDYTVFNDKYQEVPIEKSPFLRSLHMPKNDYVPSWYNAPTVQLTDDENQQVSEIMNPIKTYVTEEQAKFVSGKENFNDWTKFIEKLKKMGDIDKVLKIYDDAAKRVLSK